MHDATTATCRKKKSLLLLVLATPALLVGYYTVFYSNQLQSKKIAMATGPTIRDHHTVVIYYPPDFGAGIPRGFAAFYKNDCSVRNCMLTKADAYKHTADVVIFGENSEWEPPSSRSMQQIWILRLLESPENTRSLMHYRGKINVTASYHSGSDILTPYGVFEYFSTEKISDAPVDYAKGKSRLVLWLVSHCLTGNNRMLYAQRLSNYIQVDIYGLCGKGRLAKEEARRLIKQHYKFYLAFENSNCRQYISEKFWINALGSNAVPVVMGAPKSDYLKVAPPHSFIHVDDFDPHALAKYLIYLNDNDTAYNEYFSWKGFGRVATSDFYCRLCAFVQSPPRKTYDNIDLWWRQAGECRNYTT